MLTISESSDTVEVCLTTQSIPVMDTVINVTVIYDSAGKEGEMYAGTNITLRIYFVQNYAHTYLYVLQHVRAILYSTVIINQLYILPSLDFNLLTEEVVITSTDTEPCIVFIALADSLALEGEEMLTLSLSGPESVMINNATITITIVDTDGMYT